MISVGKEKIVTHRRIWLFAIVLLAAIPAWGQPSAALPEYFLLTESSVAGADSAEWADAVTLVAKAHAQHPQGNTWVTYRKLTGGPEEAVRTFFPLDRLGDLDEWISNRQILTETLGADRTRIVLQDLDLAEDAGERLLSYSAKMSRPWPDFQAPRYAWVEEVTVADGKMVEYAALVDRLVRAFNEHDSQGYWVIYGNAIGGDSSSVIWIYGFDKFAEIDDWDSRLETLAKAMPSGEAPRLLAALEAISQSTTSLWQMEAALSQLEGR